MCASHLPLAIITAILHCFTTNIQAETFRSPGWLVHSTVMDCMTEWTHLLSLWLGLHSLPSVVWTEGLRMAGWWDGGIWQKWGGPWHHCLSSCLKEEGSGGERERNEDVHRPSAALHFQLVTNRTASVSVFVSVPSTFSVGIHYTCNTHCSWLVVYVYMYIYMYMYIHVHLCTPYMNICTTCACVCINMCVAVHFIVKKGKLVISISTGIESLFMCIWIYK